jgi:hypothetical protein
LNQCCALVCILESILLILVVKILLQHNPPESGQLLRQSECPLGANSRLMQCSKQHGGIG